MAFDWTTHTFSSLIKGGALEIGDGYRAKNDELGGDGPIFLRAGHVSDTGIDFSGVDRFTYPNAVRFGSKLSQVGDVVITTKGNSTGRVTFVTSRMPPFVYSPHLSYWRTKPGSILMPGFLKAWSRSQEFGTQLSALSRSTDMAPYLSLQDQRSLTITVPPVAVQQAISALAIGIDDRIDHNRALADNLEAIARALFKSWFVDFDPVRAKAAGEAPPGLAPDLAALFPDRFVDSELGEIPQGWHTGTVGEICRNIRVGCAASAISPDDFYVGLEHIDRRCLTLWKGGIGSDATSNKSRFQKGDLLFGKLRPYFHKVAIAPCDGICSTDILVIRSKSDNERACTHLALFQDEVIQFVSDASGGTRMPRTNWETLAARGIVVAPSEVRSAFDDLVRPLCEAATVAVAESRALAQMRDLLLPRLISGKLRVEDAEAALEAA